MDKVKPCEKAGIIDPLKPCAMSGALRGVYSIRDAVPIVHGASGCQLMYWLLFNSELSSRHQAENRVLSTRMEEKDVVYGGKRKLKEALLKADRMFKPNLIVVILACAASITGEDHQSVITSLEGQLKAKVIAVDAGGFSGDALEGQLRLMKALVLNLMDPSCEKVPNSVNLLGMSYDDYNWRADIKELKRILRLMGINVISSISIADSTEEIKRAPAAQINVILSDETGLRIGEIMEQRFGIPYICHDQVLPYGVENTSEWVMKIAAAFGKEEIAKKIVAKESKQAYKKLVWKMAAYNQLRWFHSLPVGIFLDATRAIGIAKYVYRELLMDPVLISCRSMGPNSRKHLDEFLASENLSSRVLEAPDLSTQAEAIKESNNIDLAFGSTLEMVICQKAGIKSFVGMSTPIYHKAYVDERPFMGYRGAIYLYEEILNERLKLYFSRTPYGHVWDLSRYVNVEEGFDWQKIL